MAPAIEDTEQDDEVDSKAAKPPENGRPEQESDEEDDGDEEEEEEEPRLEYASMTKKLTAVYRYGDATSTFLVAGDKMVRLFWPYTHRGWSVQA